MRSLTGWVYRETGFRVFRDSFLTTSKGPLHVSTPVLTTKGWKQQGDLEVGDFVFALDGSPAEVIAVSEVFHDKECYKLTFGDGTEIVASGDHRWYTEQRVGCRGMGKFSVDRSEFELEGWRTTEEIFNTQSKQLSKHLSLIHI